MEILLWLLPAAALTLLAMVGIAWWGREGRGERQGRGDRDEAARLLGEALARTPKGRPGYAVAPRDPERSSGVALRPSASRPTVVPDADEGPGATGAGVTEAGDPADPAGPETDRRAS